MQILLTLDKKIMRGNAVFENTRHAAVIIRDGKIATTMMASAGL